MKSAKSMVGLLCLLLSACAMHEKNHYVPITDEYTYDINGYYAPLEPPPSITTNLRLVPYAKPAVTYQLQTLDPWVAPPVKVQVKRKTVVKVKALKPEPNVVPLKAMPVKPADEGWKK